MVMISTANMHSPQNVGPIPVTRNMPYTSTSVPSRNQPRNMTGIYLGLEGNIKPPQSRFVVPPLARGRGMSQRIRTPTEDRRYRMVDSLRIREEKRGFVGQPIKSAKSRKQASKSAVTDQRRPPPVDRVFNDHAEMSPRSAGKRWGPGKALNSTEFDHLIRTNPRNYTVVINNGVTRSENLTGWMSFDESPEDYQFADAVAEEVHRLSVTNEELFGLEECYKKVCKGNVETLHSLLPNKKHFPPAMQRENTYSTGFSVRSYRNPTKAEIIADFPDSHTGAGRPKTVPIQHQRPYVPGPYFFKYYSHPISKVGVQSAKTRKTPASNFEDQFDSVTGTAKVIASPGVGGLSRGLKVRNTAWAEGGVLRKGTPRESEDRDTPREEGKQVQISMRVATSDRESDRDQESDITTPDDGQFEDSDRVQALASDRPSADDMNVHEEKTRREIKPKQRQNSADIVIGVETEDGGTAEVEIDAAEDDPFTVAPQGNLRKAPLAGKIEKSKESEAYVATLQENAEKRKKDLAKMLDEHAEIVKEIRRASSSDLEAEALDETEGQRDQ